MEARNCLAGAFFFFLIKICSLHQEMRALFCLEKSGILSSPHYKRHLCFLNICAGEECCRTSLALESKAAHPACLCKWSSLCPGREHSSAAAGRERGTLRNSWIFSDFQKAALPREEFRNTVFKKSRITETESRWLIWLQSSPTLNVSFWLGEDNAFC